MSTAKFRRRKGTADASDNDVEESKESIASPTPKSVVRDLPTVQQAPKRIPLPHQEEDPESIALKREYVASRKRTEVEKPSPMRDVVHKAKSVYFRRFSTIAAPHSPAQPDYSNSKHITDPMFALLYALPKGVPTKVMMSFWASLMITAILPSQVFFSVIIVTLACVWYAGLDAPPGLPKRWLLVSTALIVVTEILVSKSLGILVGLSTAIWCLFSCVIDDIMYGDIGRWKHRHLRDKILACLLLMLAVVEWSCPLLPYVYITPFIFAAVGMVVQYIVLREHISSLVRHPSMQFVHTNPASHWLLLTMRLGIPGIELKMDGRDDDFDFCSALNASQKEGATYSAAVPLVTSWLRKFHPSLNETSIPLFSTAIAQHNLAWLAARPSSRELQVYYDEACALYRYDRYVRPWATKIAQFFTTPDIIVEYRKTLSASVQEKCVWIIEPKTHECGDAALWNNIAVSHNPSFVSQGDNMHLLIKYMSHAGSGLICNMTMFACFVMEKIYYDLVWNSKLLGAAISWMTPKKPKDEQSDNNDAEEDSLDVAETNGELSAKEVVASFGYYLTSLETERAFSAAMGHGSGITRYPILDFCLFYSIQHLKPSVLEVAMSGGPVEGAKP